MLCIEDVFIFKRIKKAAIILLRYSTGIRLANFFRVESVRFFQKDILSGRPYFTKIQRCGIKYCEAGKRKPRIATLEGYARAVGFDVEAALGIINATPKLYA